MYQIDLFSIQIHDKIVKMKKLKVRHKTGPQLIKIEKLLDEVSRKKESELPYIPEKCTNECIFRQRGFCMEKMAPAPKYDEPCYINRERG